MKELSRSVRQAKQAKFWMLTVPVRTVRTVMWQGRTIMMTWQLDDVAHFYWLVVVQSGVDTCHKWPIKCGHVAKSFGTTCPYMTG
jgi:hypothetical protein